MAYARHQSFYLRDKWLSKGLKSVEGNSRFFYKDDSFEKIGLGKNMVEALKYWLFAFGVIEEKIEDGLKVHSLTNLGQLIFRFDRVLQHNVTLSILHYKLICNDNDQSTVFDWFFNTYKETAFKKVDLNSSFETWVSLNESKEISDKSLKRDIDCLIQFYTKQPNELDPEDVTFSPFSKLQLLKIEPSVSERETIKKISPDIETIGVNALYFVLLDYCHKNKIELVSINEIVNEKYLWGTTYNLSRNKIIEALNVLTNHDKYPIQYVRTNNLDYIKVAQIEPMVFLNDELGKRVVL
ncbi:DUF4007 family protein [Paenibacillus sp. SZ31]|uniref:DUF4007 family protein n=1 Tax=Paenibacillus sp. SZ31 TaxID=2725555 RepID=UPI00146C009D|nr:DUF4007 family protein [Paenibacillus sp. SZ31]NMI07776.1 DUF4007 family protein [Paenibacillus sp. SZ31]